MPELKARVSESDHQQLVAVVRRSGWFECVIAGPEDLVLAGLFELGLNIEAIQGLPERLHLGGAGDLQTAMCKGGKGGAA